MRRGNRGYDRTQRVGDLIQQALAQLLLQDMTDERFRLVTITSVTVSRDLSYAKIYVGVLSEDKAEVDSIIKALNRSVKSLRYQLAKQVELRMMPELKFVYDESTAYGFKINTLINAAIKKTDKEDNE